MKKIILCIAVAGLAASPVWAQRIETDKTEMEDAFQDADIIIDGYIDAGEFDIYNLNVFDMLDEDGDRVLIQNECYKGCFPTDLDQEKNGESATRHYRFEALDSNRNGQIAQSEYISYARKQFRDYDRNEDKLLEKEEFFAFYQGMDERMFMAKDFKNEDSND